MNISAHGVRREGEILLRMKAQPERGLAGDALAQICDQFEATLVQRFELPGERVQGQASDIVHLRLEDPESTDQALQTLKQDPRVAYAEPNFLLFELERPNDLDPKLWGLDNQLHPGNDIHALEAWKIQAGTPGTGPLVAVLDSGCDYHHADLAANIWRNPGEIPGNGIDDDGNGVIDDVHGFNAAARSGDPMDDRSHGTHVCGTVGAVGNNGTGVVGANGNAQIMPVKFLQGGYGDTADAIEGILYATQMGARITSNSWGGINYSQALYDVLASSPALHICAAGNDSANNDIAPVYPAGYQIPNLLAVAATNSEDELAKFSNYGVSTVHTAAPGDKIYSTMPGNEYGYKSGTSMAAPHVSGVASLIATEYPEISNQQLKDRLIFGVDRKPALEGKTVSGGRLNAAKALERDVIAPAPVSQLRALQEAITPFEVPIQWQASGDDGLEGQATAYEIRYSTKPILNEEDFQAAQQAPPPVPKPAGETENVTVKVHPRGHQRELHFAVRAVDNVGLRGPIAQVAVQVPAAQVAFAGDAEAGKEAWSATGSWGLQSVPGRGEVWTDSPNGNYGEGENSSLTSKAFSLKGYSNATLSLECRHDIEKIFDSITLEITRDGEQWDKLASYEGRIGWEERNYDLTAYCGQAQDVQLRFRLKTDLDVCLDGFYLDKLVVTGSP